MKYAGLTWWRNNYGSILQAYALQEVLKKENIDYEILCQYGKKVASVNNLKEKLKRIGLRKTIYRIFWKFGLKKLRNRNRKIQKFMDEQLVVSKKQYNEQTIFEANQVYDGFICGSDQIWNPELVSVDSMYWLNFADANKTKIAYAPSIGVNQLSADQAQSICRNLESFAAVSCREDSGTRLINETVGENICQTVLDPTLLVERSLWDDICAPDQYQQPYLFVYMLRGTKAERKLIEQYAKKKKLKIITMPFLDNQKTELYDFRFGDIRLWDASPEEFISVIRYADTVVTDSFHCMVFSCLYHRRFFTFPKIGKSQLNRITGLQELFGIPSRMISGTHSVEQMMKMPEIDWTIVDERLKEQRKMSGNYLLTALNKAKKG